MRTTHKARSHTGLVLNVCELGVSLQDLVDVVLHDIHHLIHLLLRVPDLRPGVEVERRVHVGGHSRRWIMCASAMSGLLGSGPSGHEQSETPRHIHVDGFVVCNDALPL